jgi:competence protein ComEA
MEIKMEKIKTLAAIVAFTFSSLTFASPVNINTASASEISEALNGIGMVKAQAIVDFRTTNGLFSSADQITMVNGIGDSTYEKIKADLLLK